MAEPVGVDAPPDACGAFQDPDAVTPALQFVGRDETGDSGPDDDDPAAGPFEFLECVSMPNLRSGVHRCSPRDLLNSPIEPAHIFHIRGLVAMVIQAVGIPARDFPEGVDKG
ncbi:hypothetical protein [Streptomyces triculaminicus]|uniref:hypothetical protein n=1 Tax=Streptomyces triculaminicus TaxID=2816232 RepID=UPI0037CD2744